MKSKLTKRILAVACAAIVLSVLFAITGFAAEIKGGFGVIEGVDGNYKAAPASINTNGTALTINTTNAIVLSETNNKNLVGLYAVSNDNFATKTIVYVYGSYKERASLGTAKNDTTLNGSVSIGTEWTAGEFLGFSPVSSTNSNYTGNAYVGANRHVFSSDWVTAYNFGDVTNASDKAQYISILKKRRTKQNF